MTVIRRRKTTIRRSFDANQRNPTNKLSIFFEFRLRNNNIKCNALINGLYSPPTVKAVFFWIQLKSVHSAKKFTVKLYTRCHSCNSEISFLSDANDRVELEMRKGKQFPITCTSCHKKNKYHVNNFTATLSFGQKLVSFLVTIGLVLALISAEIFVFSLGFFFYGGVFLVPSAAFFIINKQQQTRLNSFNRYKVKE